MLNSYLLYSTHLLCSLIRLAERIAEKQLQTKIKFSEPEYRSGLKQLTRAFDLPGSTLTVVQGINPVYASNNRRDRRRTISGGNERDMVHRDMGGISEPNSVRMSVYDSSSLSASHHNSTDDVPQRTAGGDIRNWLFIEQSVGDILVRVCVCLSVCVDGCMYGCECASVCM